MDHYVAELEAKNAELRRYAEDLNMMLNTNADRIAEQAQELKQLRRERDDAVESAKYWKRANGHESTLGGFREWLLQNRSKFAAFDTAWALAQIERFTLENCNDPGIDNQERESGSGGSGIAGRFVRSG